MLVANCNSARNTIEMLTELYIVALQVDEDLADQVFELLDAGVITDEVAAWAWAWCILAACSDGSQRESTNIRFT